MMFQAVLGNPHHPEYGVATIPFPIPRDQYAHCMELLEALEIGDAVKADCKVEKIDSFYTVLKRTEMLTVNVEELNYLAKRLDSFDTGEAAQFQAMAHKLELFELKDLINLTFCCQQATVITDFSDLAAIGRDHYMNLHGGSASVDELNELDGKGTARQLIESGSGTITPYGVVYDNGMKLEQVYDGRFFPCYYYEPNAITVAVTSKTEPEDTEHITWLYADEGAILELTGDMTLYAKWQIWSGWFTDVNGKQYYQNGELQKTGWTVIDGKTYYLDTETGYAATGITTLVPGGATEEARCVFDAEGVFQSDVTGVFSVGNDTYWLNSGIIEEEAGLKRVVKENGKVNYYYFAVQKNLEERDGLTLSAAVKSTVLNGKDCWLHKTNGLALPEWGYYFDENGIILHDEDTGKNGILKDGEDLFYYVDGIKAPAGMIKIGDDYYYANSKGQLIVNQTYYCSRMNGLMEEGTYAFDAEGKLIQGATDKNGIVKDDDGVLRYYVNGKVTYVGLIEIDGDFYYVRSSGEVVTNCVYWITWTHGLKEAGYYTFDESGKLTGTPKNGIVEEDGVLHYYVNGTLTYAGLIKIGDDYYYVNSKCEVVRDCDYYISWTHDLMPQGRYHFDADGKLTGSVAPLKNGIYEEDGSLYFYRNGERTYAGLIQIDGNYYYVRSTCEVVHDRSYYVYWTHDLKPQGYYNFDSAGRMILDSETE